MGRAPLWMLALTAGLAALGCDKESKPVDIAFSAAPVGDAPDPVALATATGSADASEDGKGTGKSRGRGRRIKLRQVQPKPTTAAPSGKVMSCCSTLSSRAMKATDESTRKMNNQAAAVCYTKLNQVKDGKLDQASALAAVRSSLLGDAPAACN